jgi:ATP-binding cassette, subfamily B, bacterial MsbA
MSRRGEDDSEVWSTYSRLLQYTRRYWWILSGSIFGYALYAATNPGAAHFVKILTEVIQDENRSHSTVLLICAAPFIFAIVQGTAQLIGSYCLAWVGQHIVFEIRNEVFVHLLQLPQRIFQKNASGRIMSKIIFDAQQITSAGTDAVTVLLREGLTAIALLGYLVYLNWQLTLVLFTVGPVVAFVIGQTSKRFRKLSRRIQDSMGGITQYLGEAIDGIQVVKIFGGREQEADRFAKVSRSFEKNNIKLVVTKVVSNSLVQMVVGLGVGVIVYLYIYISGDEIEVSTFIAFVGAIAMIQKPIKQLNEVNSKIQRGVTGAASLFELLDMESERDIGTVSLSRAKGKIEFKNVSFSYNPEQPVISDLSFVVNPGETVALVGRSGAGKSTIAAMVPRFYDAESGQILLDDVPLEQYRLDDLRRQVSLVSQKVVLFNDSIRNNIAYGEMSEKDVTLIEQAAKDAHAMEFVSELDQGLETEVGQDGTQLSGGQRQRIAIARSLLKDAPILILDEATSALDNESEFRIQQALEHVMSGRTTLVIAHRLSTIEKADRILVMDDGRLVESGTHAELLEQNGYYTQLYRMNFAE